MKIIQSSNYNHKRSSDLSGKLVWVMAALLGSSALSALASDPVGVYAFVDKIVLEPSDGAPQRIRSR